MSVFYTINVGHYFISVLFQYEWKVKKCPHCCPAYYLHSSFNECSFSLNETSSKHTSNTSARRGGLSAFLMTKAEVRSGEPSRADRPLGQWGPRRKRSPLLCSRLLVCCGRASIPGCLHPTPEIKTTRAKGNGVSRPRRAEGAGAAYRGGRVSPQTGLSGTWIPAPC